MRIFLTEGWLQLFTVVGGTILPLIVDFVTKSTAEPRIKAFLLLVLSFVGAAIAEAVVATGGWDVEAWLWTAVPTFVVAVAALFGIHMPTGLHAAAKRAVTG